MAALNHEWGSSGQEALLSSYRAIFQVAAPAALFRVSGVLAATLLTSLVGRLGGTDMLAAFAVVGVTTKTACLLFAFLSDGVAAKVGSSVAHEPAGCLSARVRLYFASCIVLGAATAAVLIGARGPILHPFHLRLSVRELAEPYWTLLSLLVPLTLLNLSIAGTLQGLRHVGLSAALEAAAAAAEVAGACWALTSPSLGSGAARLRAIARVRAAAAAACAAAGSASVWAALRQHGHQGIEPGQASLPRHGGQEGVGACAGEEALRAPLLAAGQAGGHLGPPAVARVEGPGGSPGSWQQHALAGGSAVRASGSRLAMRHLRELLQDGANVMVRSLLVQGSMWLTAVAAAGLGTPALAAHQILTQLWMLPTHFSGGFAVAGIVLGSRLARGAGEGGQLARRGPRRLSRRLLLLSAAFGISVGCGLAAGRHLVISSLFQPNPDVVAVLQGPAWICLCVLQPLTSALFTLTGLIYGAHYFGFLRNVLALGFFGVFCPALLWVVHRQEVADGREANGLGAVWLVKLGFYTWQAVAEGTGVARAYGYWGAPHG